MTMNVYSGQACAEGDSECRLCAAKEQTQIWLVIKWERE